MGVGTWRIERGGGRLTREEKWGRDRGENTWMRNVTCNSKKRGHWGEIVQNRRGSKRLDEWQRGGARNYENGEPVGENEIEKTYQLDFNTGHKSEFLSKSKQRKSNCRNKL